MIMYAVWYMSNPHHWNNGNKTLISLFDDKELANTFINMNPDYVYVTGEKEPAMVLRMTEVPIGVILDGRFKE